MTKNGAKKCIKYILKRNYCLLRTMELSAHLELVKNSKSWRWFKKWRVQISSDPPNTVVCFFPWSLRNFLNFLKEQQWEIHPTLHCRLWLSSEETFSNFQQKSANFRQLCRFLIACERLWQTRQYFLENPKSKSTRKQRGERQDGKVISWKYITQCFVMKTGTRVKCSSGCCSLWCRSVLFARISCGVARCKSGIGGGGPHCHWAVCCAPGSVGSVHQSNY